MKKISLLIMAVMAFGLAQAQNPHKVYCELLGQAKLFSSKVTVTVDFGQNQWQNNKLVDENGKNITFNSMVDAMNFMGELGWEFEQAYVITIGSGASSQNVYHWLLSRYITEEEAINSGLKLKAEHNAEKRAAKEAAKSADEE